jgi:hypothetical protein
VPELGLRTVLSLARHLVVFEVRLYRSLGRWIARRPAVPAGAEPFGYAQGVTPVLWLWIFGSATEVVVVHLILPWDAVRLAALVVGIWGLMWMVGLLASLRVHPHLVTAAGLRVRHGASVDVQVPWDAVRSVTTQRRDLDSSVWTLQPRKTPEGTDLQVAVSGTVNVTVRLSRPLRVPTRRKGELEVVAVSLLADDAAALVRRVRELSPAPTQDWPHYARRQTSPD